MPLGSLAVAFSCSHVQKKCVLRHPHMAASPDPAFQRVLRGEGLRREDLRGEDLGREDLRREDLRREDLQKEDLVGFEPVIFSSRA